MPKVGIDFLNSDERREKDVVVAKRAWHLARPIVDAARKSMARDMERDGVRYEYWGDFIHERQKGKARKVRTIWHDEDGTPYQQIDDILPAHSPLRQRQIQRAEQGSRIAAVYPDDINRGPNHSLATRRAKAVRIGPDDGAQIEQVAQGLIGIFGTRLMSDYDEADYRPADPVFFDNRWKPLRDELIRHDLASPASIIGHSYPGNTLEVRRNGMYADADFLETVTPAQYDRQVNLLLPRLVAATVQMIGRAGTRWVMNSMASMENESETPPYIGPMDSMY